MNQLTKICIKCGKELPATIEFFYKKDKYRLDSRCKKCVKSCQRSYNKNNKDKIKAYNKAYWKKNKDKIEEQRKNCNEIYREKNRERAKIYNEKNKEKINEKIKIHQKKKALYNTYKNHESLILVEEIRQDPINNELLQVKCTYCGRWINPTNLQINHRICAVNGTTTGEGRFYCDDNNNMCCKSCPIYRKQNWPKGFKKATSREVQPELRQMVLARDNYTCQKCGITIDQAELHCHHITGIVQNPLESADVDNCVTLCKACHKEVHKLSGCRYHELKCANGG